MANKGTVIKIHNKRAVIMTDQCDFKEIVLKYPAQVGDTVDYRDEDIQYNSGSRKLPALVASVLLCLFFVSSLILYKPLLDPVYAYISFDINPGLEIKIDRNIQVIGVRSFNQDGQQLLEHNQISNGALDQAISYIIRQSRQDSYLHADKMNYVAVSLYYPGDIRERNFLSDLNAMIAKELEDNHLKATIFYYMVNKQAYEQASQYNVSPARWVIWQAAQHSGFNYDLNGDLPWQDKRLLDTASGKADRVIDIGARDGAANLNGKAPETQPIRQQESAGREDRGTQGQLSPLPQNADTGNQPEERVFNNSGAGDAANDPNTDQQQYGDHDSRLNKEDSASHMPNEYADTEKTGQSAGAANGSSSSSGGNIERSSSSEESKGSNGSSGSSGSAGSGR